MRRIVVSAPRSGRNWLKFWVEATGGTGFVASHDPLKIRPRRWWREWRASPAWQAIDPAATGGDRVVLILRDPAEVLVRACGGNLRKFLSYDSCLRFYSQACGPRLAVHYEDLVADPAAMHRVLTFLEVPRLPALAQIADDWAEAGRISRERYGARHSSGALTRLNPLDFTFHQRALTDSGRAALWRHLDDTLAPDETALIARYRRTENFAPGGQDVLAQRAG